MKNNEILKVKIYERRKALVFSEKGMPLGIVKEVLKSPLSVRLVIKYL